jgi:mannose-6-phosphate isomerase-like protein (cupin superfamily)
MSRYDVARLDEIEEIDDGRCLFRAVRQHFGITSFGVNAWTAAAAGDRIINEHDEADEHEELYLVVQGRARFELDGKSVDAPTGTFVFAEPGVVRTAFAEEAGTTVLALGGAPGKVYEPTGYEVWSPIRPLYDAGRYGEAADALRAIVETDPNPWLLYNLACCESLAGRGADAVEHLRRAFERGEQFREYARGDSDFDAIRDEPGFAELVGAQ